jgi:hypothetical protein
VDTWIKSQTTHKKNIHDREMSVSHCKPLRLQGVKKKKKKEKEKGKGWGCGSSGRALA